jgi:ketosteroid isomerase-like protein
LRIALALAVGVTLACAAQSPPPAIDPNEARAAIKVRMDSLVAAEVAEDSALSVSFYAEDAVVQPANMPAIRGRTEIGKLYGMFFPMVQTMSSTTTEVHVAASGDMAWEFGVNRLTMNGATAPTMGKYLVVWKKAAEVWQVAAIAFSDDVPPPAAPPAGASK